jgi:putative transposase
MKTLYHAFLLLLARATDRELAIYLDYLKAENKILRARLPQCIVPTAQERRQLMRLGKPLGPAIKDLITIVSPKTFLRWLRAEGAPPAARTPRGPGRPPTPDLLRELVLRIAGETGWGYSRILGELQKLGLGTVCRNTVKNILRQNGFDPGPQRGEGSWADFIKRHAATLWACDFFSKPVWTLRGLVDVYVLFFIHVDSRRVHIAGLTAHPDRVWMTQQARNLAIIFGEQSVAPKILLRDHDTKFVGEFDAILEAEGIAVKPVGPRAPNLNAYAERWVQSIKHECLDHFCVFGEDHLRHLLGCYTDYYHRQRPHQAKENRPLTVVGSATEQPADPANIICEERLGGLLRHYRPAA